MKSHDSRLRDNVIVPAPNVMATGGVLIGDVIKDTEAFPKNATDDINEAFNAAPAGFIAESGLTKTVDHQTEDIKDSNKDVVVTIETTHDVTVKWTFQESTNATVLKSIYGANNVKVEDGNITVADRSGMVEHRSFFFEMDGGNKRPVRAFIPDGQVINVGEISLMKKDDIIKYEVTVKCFTDPTAAKFYTFFGDGSLPKKKEEKEILPKQTTKTVTLPEEVSGGTWSLTVDGHTAESLAHNASGEAVQSALQEAGASEVTVSGSEGGPYTVTGGSSVTADGEELTGGDNNTITVK